MVRPLIGTRIREVRRACHMTQKALAQKAGISPSYLNLIEHNRRGIAGRVLIAIAHALDTDPGSLSDTAGAGVISQLTELTQTHTRAEAERTEEFAARFPGWASVIVALAQTTRTQAERLTALSDRLNHDPFLSETFHQILSNITAIRSTAGILDTTPDIPEDQRSRFVSNLRADSQRLSETAQAIVDSFETQTPAEIFPSAARTQGQAFWADRGFWLEALEPDRPLYDPSSVTGAERAKATQTWDLEPTLSRYAAMAKALPFDAFTQAAEATNFDPMSMAHQAGVSVETVLLRLAHAPTESTLPVFGMIEVDLSGAVLLRKDIPAFQLPQFASACPLWPIYRAFAAPGQPIRAVLEMPTGERLISYAIASTQNDGGYAMPPLMRATMIVSADTRALPDTRAKVPLVLAGLHCSVCPRKSCLARQADYILA